MKPLTPTQTEINALLTRAACRSCTRAVTLLIIHFALDRDLACAYAHSWARRAA